MRIMNTSALDFKIRAGKVRTTIVKDVPWAMLEACERRAQRNHGQSLERLAERGGLDAGETLCILDDKSWDEAYPGTATSGLSVDDEETLHIRLAARIAAWEKEHRL